MRLAAVAIALLGCGSPPRAPLDDASPTPGADGAIDATTVDGAPDAALPLGDPIAGLQALPPVCSDAGWCWNEPTPSGTFYSRIVSSAPDNIWISGGGPPGYAAILQWDGHAWTTHKPPVPAGYPEYLLPMSIATSAPDNTWLVYNNLLERWDGEKWTIVDNLNNTNSQVLNGVWVDPTSGDAWVTLATGLIDVWHQGVMKELSIGAYAGTIYGTGPSDVFVTTIGALYHYDGTQFSTVYAGGKTAAWYQGTAGDVWISGDAGVMLHWDGTQLVDHTADVLATGIPTSAVIQSASYASATDVSWLVTGNSAAPGNIIHWDGTQFTQTPFDPGTNALGDNVCGDLGASKAIGGTWWMVCDGGAVSTVSGTTAAPVIGAFDGTGSMWGTAKNDLYLATGGQLRHFDGTTWTATQMPILGISGIPGTGIGGTTELFGTHFQFTAGAYHTFFDHFDGMTWTSLPVGTFTFSDPLQFVASVVPLAHDDALIVGGAGTAYHYQAGTLTKLTTPTVDLIGILPSGSDHASITGSNGTLLTWDRNNLPTTLVVDPSFPTSTDNLGAIAATPNATWIVPANELYVWMKPTGGAWTQIQTHVSPMSIAAISDKNVVVTASDSGLVSRWNGTAFTIETYPNWEAMFSIFALPDGTTYVSGTTGIIMHP